MNYEKIYGFRYMITGIYKGKFGIKDLKDEVTEFYDKDSVFELAKIVRIAGVENGGINLDWFRDYFARVKLIYTDKKDLASQFGVDYIHNKVLLYTFVLREGGDSFSCIKFIEFVEDLVSVIEVNNIDVRYRRLGATLTDKALKGVGFPRVRNVEECGKFLVKYINDNRISQMVRKWCTVYFEDINSDFNLFRNSGVCCSKLSFNINSLGLFGAPDGVELHIANVYTLFISKEFDLSSLVDIDYITLVLEDGVDLYRLSTLLNIEFSESFKFYYGIKQVNGKGEIVGFTKCEDMHNFRLITGNNLQYELSEKTAGYYVKSDGVLDWANIRCTQGFYDKVVKESDIGFVEKHGVSKDYLLSHLEVI